MNNLQSQSMNANPNFISNMPSLKAFAKMTDDEVFIYLSRLSNSEYYGQNPKEIKQSIG